MNRERRMRIKHLVLEIRKAETLLTVDLAGVLDTIRDEEQEALDSTPDNLLESQAYYDREELCAELDDVHQELEYGCALVAAIFDFDDIIERLEAL